MSVCSHFSTLNNNTHSYLPEENESHKQTSSSSSSSSSLSSKSNMQMVEQEAAAYNARRTEVKVTCSHSSESGEQVTSVLVPSWDDPTKLASFFAPTIEQLLPIAGWRGSGMKQLLLTTRNIHLIMREQYSEMIHQVGRNIFPCIIASENDMNYRGVGSMFTLYLEDGSIRRTKVPPPEYEIYKNLSHMPLAIYTIISPYFLQPTVGGWEDKLKIMTSKITSALSVLTSESMIESSQQIHYRSMLIYTQEYIEKCLHYKTVDTVHFQKYCELMLPFVTISMARAAEIQVCSAKPQLEAWKCELEAIDQWKNTYVIIPSVWPVGYDNPRQRLFKQLMNEQQFQTHVIMSEMPRDMEESLNLLGRVVGDRVAARLIFGCSTAGARSMVCALSTERDLVSDACQDAIQKLFGENDKTSLTNDNRHKPVYYSTPLTACQLRVHAAQSTSSELQKALLHTATLMEMEETKNNEIVVQSSGTTTSTTNGNMFNCPVVSSEGHDLQNHELLWKKSLKY